MNSLQKFAFSNILFKLEFKKSETKGRAKKKGKKGIELWGILYKKNNKRQYSNIEILYKRGNLSLVVELWIWST